MIFRVHHVIFQGCIGKGFFTVHLSIPPMGFFQVAKSQSSKSTAERHEANSGSFGVGKVEEITDRSLFNGILRGSGYLVTGYL